MKNLNDLSEFFILVSKKLPEKAAENVRETAFAIYQPLMSSTPVDRGIARSNWFVTIDSQTDETTDKPKAPGELLEEARTEINKFSQQNKTIYITNNLPYIKRLNEGWSAQAAAGFVERAVKAGTEAIGKLKWL